jgi:hypothetical protein
MTMYRQLEANRHNSLKSTGPKMETGKQVSRCNAVRHGLTAETVIGALEDTEDYKAFEAAITADYDAHVTSMFASGCNIYFSSRESGTLKRSCSLGRGSKIIMAPEPRHLILAT